ncbi:HTH-type transcriptional activator RhaR [Paenibacillus solanacearum]|uniref:HTH-type transcriptional activator RhaR n=1 Tax=Paenibacillus solanacearum TaxID=2048548 RepID=A0A916JVY0_9BACL|nr:AraC family transcriptional regulator [Paenibacillus solanacearum]CAG7609211.1 HTH-type transcriptional activator RhaR [Paenibacillus solanacearum]
MIKIFNVDDEVLDRSEMNIDLRKATERPHRRESVSGAIVQNAIRSLILGEENDRDQMKSLIHQYMSMPVRSMVVAALQVESFIMLTARLTVAERNQMIRSVMAWCQRFVNERKEGIVSYIDQGGFAIVFFSQEYSFHSILQQAESVLQKMKKSLEVNLNISVDYAYADVIHDLVHTAESYESASSLLNKRSVSGRGHGGSYDLWGNPIASLSLEHERKLMTAVKLLDTKSAHSILDDVFLHLKERSLSDESLQLVVNELIHIAGKIWVKSMLNKDPFYNGDDLTREQIRQCKQASDILIWLKQMYKQLIEKLSPADPGVNYSNHVSLAIKYIKMCYHDPISLDQAADKAGVSASYLCRSFKEETGCGFTEYVNKVRVRAAQQWIESGEYTMKEIYEKAGFSSYNYFFKVFKDTTGVTPHTYRKSMKLTREG